MSNRASRSRPTSSGGGAGDSMDALDRALGLGPPNAGPGAAGAASGRILKVNASLRVPLMHGCRVWAIQRIWEMPVLMINAVTTVLTLSIQHRLHSETQLKSQMRRKSSLRLRSQAPPEENRKRKQRLQHRVNQNSMPRSSTKPSVCRPSPRRASHHSIWIYIACRGTTMITVTRT